MSRYDLAREIFTRAFSDEKLIRQSPDLWLGDFPLPEDVARYYAEFGAFDANIAAYGNSFFLPRLERLWEYQTGYRFDGRTNERVKDWDDDWLVVADQGADPFIYSRRTGKILYAYHGAGEWNPSELFADLPAMVTSLVILGGIIVEAGEDFTDEDCYINGRFINLGKERLSRLLNSDVEAEVILDTFGWSR